MKESEKAVVVAGGVFQKKTFTAALFVGVFQKKTFSGGKTAPGCRRSDCGRMPPHMRDKKNQQKIEPNEEIPKRQNFLVNMTSVKLKVKR